MSTGPIGYLIHWSSKKGVHPLGGAENPDNDTEIVVFHGLGDDNPGRLQFRFVAVDGAGHFGYIEHVKSGKIVHPKGGSLDPPNDTRLVLHSGRHAGCLFGFDEANHGILHKCGRYWHPKGGSPAPEDNTSIVVYDTLHDGAKFYFGDINKNPISPYPEPNLSGDWKLLRAYITPLADHTYSERYKVGRSETDSETNQHAWNVSAEVAIAFFSAKSEYAGFVEATSSTTWTEEREETKSISVTKGQTVYVWQYVFGMAQYGEELHFSSTITGDTDSKDKRPVLAR